MMKMTNRALVDIMDEFQEKANDLMERSIKEVINLDMIKSESNDPTRMMFRDLLNLMDLSYELMFAYGRDMSNIKCSLDRIEHKLEIK